MKKIMFLSVLILINHTLKAQWQTGSGSVIYYNSGNVGIGTLTPTSLFHVYNPSVLGTLIRNNIEIARFANTVGNSSSPNNMQLSVQSYRYTPGASWYSASLKLQLVVDVTKEAFIEFAPQNAGLGMAFGYGGTTTINPTEYMRITNDGNLVIGKTSQSNVNYKLDVNGSARANQMTVNTTGADFVFDSTYDLPTLNQVENFIHQHHHLPQVASADDMQKNGLDLGENQIKLLQKTEELTLYLIEQNKLINDQKRQLENLNSKMEILEKRMEALVNGKLTNK